MNDLSPAERHTRATSIIKSAIGAAVIKDLVAATPKLPPATALARGLEAAVDSVGPERAAEMFVKSCRTPDRAFELLDAAKRAAGPAADTGPLRDLSAAMGFKHPDAYVRYSDWKISHMEKGGAVPPYIAGADSKPAAESRVQRGVSIVKERKPFTGFFWNRRRSV
jgi:hypothetical protein